MERIKDWLRDSRVWGFLLSTVIMAVVSIVFFYPDNFAGNTLRQADMMQGIANAQEVKAHLEQTGHKPMWTNSLFGGMPTFQISPTYPSDSLFTWLNTVYGLGLPAPSNLLFMMMMGFFILLVAMRLRWYYALVGAMAWGLSSYFVIIIGAGHLWKFIALAYIPPTIAGLVLSYRGRYVCGAALTAIFAMLQLAANHPQMSYYFAFVMAGLVIAWLVEALRSRRLRRWLMASAVTVGAGVLALGANLPGLYNTYEYSKQTKRSQSELTAPTAAAAAPGAKAPTGGMPYDDIVGWSYGQAETFSLLVPDIKGGASARAEQGGMVFMGLDRLDGAKAYSSLPAAQLLPYLPQYYNDSEGTNGPVYVGAVVCLLFVLGCFIVRGPVKWALVVLTLLSVALAWGRNMEWLTDLMVYHFPMYNKFRAVESILVIAEFTMPLLGILALARLLGAAPDERRAMMRPLLISAGICALVCLAAIATPGIFGDAITSQDRATAAELSRQVMEMGRQYGYPAPEVEAMAYQYSLANPAVAEAVEDLRYGMTRADGWRSMLFVALGTAFLALGMARPDKRRLAVAGIGVLVLTDLYGVDKRYVSHDSFVADAGFTDPAAAPINPDRIDRAILADTAIYRVMDVPGFWQARRSYFHHMIGGYHAAKLNRYEDLIQRRLNPAIHYGYLPELRSDSLRATLDADRRPAADALAEAYRTLDMLNARYIITGDDGDPVVVNTHALGNAWLVGRVDYVASADEEMAALTGLDPARRAVADESFRPVLGTVEGTVAPGDTIELVSYAPDRLVYRATAATPLTGVFSEIWFPWGWSATIDGEPAPLARVNYLLRAMHIPAGRHEIVMTFDPASLHTTGSVAYACVTIIYLLVLAALFIEYQIGRAHV